MTGFRSFFFRVAAALVFAVGLAPAALGQIVRDTTPGQQPGDVLQEGATYVIHGREGISRNDGRLILHSFSDFNLSESETALYTDDPSELLVVENVLTRVTGGTRSELRGTIRSDYPNASLIFVNPNGVFFGRNFTLDVQQGFHVSTGDQLDFRNLQTAAITSIRTGFPDAIPDLTAAEPYAWGFLASAPAAIEVEGFDIIPTDGPYLDKLFTFVAGDVSFGTDLVPIDITTHGPALGAVAIGGPGRVESDDGEDSQCFFCVTTAGLEGSIRLRGVINTSGNREEAGSVFLLGGNLDLAGRIETAMTQSSVSNSLAGDVLLFGKDILIDLDIDTSSLIGEGGSVIVEASGSIESTQGHTINTRSLGVGSRSGEVSFSGRSVAVDLDIDTSSVGGDGGDVRISALDSLDAGQGNVINTTSSGAGTRAGSVSLAGHDISVDLDVIDASSFDGDGGNVDIRATGSLDFEVGNQILTGSSTGDGTQSGTIVLRADESLDVSGLHLDTQAFGVGSNAGNIDLVTAALIDEDFSFDISAFGEGGLDGELTITTLDTAQVPDPVQDSIESLEQLTTVDPTSPAADLAFDDPIGFGDLQPVDVTPKVATSSASSSGKKQSDHDEVSPGAALASATESIEPPQTAPFSGEIETVSEIETQIAAETASAEEKSEKKSSPVPGVSFFTNATQRLPLVPRTCESIAGEETKSHFLARTNKRIPTSPEDWLIAFDPSGDRLIASAQPADLPPVAANATSDSNLAEVQRSARTQRALASAAAAARSGRYDEAASGFEQAVRALETSGDPRGASEALLAYAQLQLSDGRYGAARESLQRALALAEPLGDEQHTAAVRSSLGNALIGTGELDRAQSELTRGLDIAMTSSDAQPAASILNNLGNQHAALRDFGSALLAYEQSAGLAHKLGNKAEEARALSGAARVNADGGHVSEAQVLLDRAMPLVDALAEPHERVPLLIHMGTTFAQLAAISPAGRARSLMNAYTAFDGALQSAEQAGDLRAVALANLNLGALYRDEQYRSEALYLTRLARRAAESIEAPELLYRAHWQEGQILWAEHEMAAALAAHRRALEILEDTKPIPSEGYGSSDGNFQQVVGAVYRDTVDLLLQTASLMRKRSAADFLIAEARDTLEKFKAAELRDYFEDECIANVSGEGRGIDKLGAKAAVVYTVTLPDRIELLVGLSSGVERFTTRIAAKRVVKTIDRFRAAVQNPLSENHRALGKQIYQWTVAPYAERIADLGIETLVFIPDGRLRTLPFAALNDGEHYLSERYATATALSLRLLTSPTVASESGRPVLAGVSESVQGFSELAAVEAELAEIKAIEGDGELFLNQAFTLERIRAAVDREVPGVVHLATHAVFTGNPDTSFLLTHSGRVGFDDLSDVVGMTRADGAPLELLVLSACETAVGNDRAGLGFTGSAIRAGARSALGSLWPISDAAARALMVDFYQGMQSPALSKAEALRKAQATLRADERFSHPFYWAPFTLVNDWM